MGNTLLENLLHPSLWKGTETQALELISILRKEGCDVPEHLHVKLARTGSEEATKGLEKIRKAAAGNERPKE